MDAAHGSVDGKQLGTNLVVALEDAGRSRKASN
jgi:hypothetical protein